MAKKITLFDWFKTNWPVLTVFILFVLAVFSALTTSIIDNQGNFTYALDDPYIHMSIAKNFSQEGIWGISKGQFSFAASSLLWPLILSGLYFVGGVNDLYPFILNFILATVLIFGLFIVFEKQRLNNFLIFVVLFAVTFLAPLPALVFTGMEHILHIILTVAFVYLAAQKLTKEKTSLLSDVPLFILAALLLATRYEGLFTLFIVVCLFFLRKRPLRGFLLGVIGILPVAVFGIISILKGGYFLPNSVLLKGNAPDVITLKTLIKFIFVDFYGRVSYYSPIMFLVLGSFVLILFLYYFKREVWNTSIVMLFIFILTAYFHMELGAIHNFFRYESYIIGLGLFVVSMSLIELFSPPQKPNQTVLVQVSTVFIILFLLAPVTLSGIYYFISERGIESYKVIPQAAKNIYEQQYQMAMFLKKFYSKDVVGLNDVGAVCYYTDVECFDFWGLVTMEVAKAKREKVYDQQFMEDAARRANVKVAIVYDDWLKFYGGIPESWIWVGEWKIMNNYICGRNRVSFYAVLPEEKDRLIENLRRFSFSLPPGVLQKGLYIKDKT